MGEEIHVLDTGAAMLWVEVNARLYPVLVDICMTVLFCEEVSCMNFFNRAMHAREMKIDVLRVRVAT